MAVSIDLTQEQYDAQCRTIAKVFNLNSYEDVDREWSMESTGDGKALLRVRLFKVVDLEIANAIMNGRDIAEVEQ